jgi:hypothetical protein
LVLALKELVAALMLQPPLSLSLSLSHFFHIASLVLALEELVAALMLQTLPI